MCRGLLKWATRRHAGLAYLLVAHLGVHGAWVGQTLAGGRWEERWEPPSLQDGSVASAVYDSTTRTLFFADRDSSRVRSVRMSPPGPVATVAGAQRGHADGTGATAAFNAPAGLAMAGLQLVVTDSGNHCIRMISLSRDDHSVTTLAGRPGLTGMQDGIGTAASFQRPTGVAVDPGGTRLVVADTGNHRLRIIELADGAVNTLAGSVEGFADGDASRARFSSPLSIAAIRDTSMFANFLLVVADGGAGKMRAIDFKRRTVVTFSLPELARPSCVAASSNGRRLAVLDDGGLRRKGLLLGLWQYISKDEFSRAVAPRFSFDVLDADGDGEITAAEYRRGFDMIDQNKDGFITELEFNSVCSVAFKLLDKDGDVCRPLVPVNECKISRSEWDAGFAVFDMDGNGKITKSEFHIVSGAGFVFELVDADGDGRITRKENEDFNLLDTDGDGVITREELNRAVEPVKACTPGTSITTCMLRQVCFDSLSGFDRLDFDHSRLLLINVDAASRAAAVDEIPLGWQLHNGTTSSSWSLPHRTGGFAVDGENGEEMSIFFADSRQMVRKFRLSIDGSTPVQATCAQGQTCGCGLGNCSCGSFYNTKCKDFCCPCPPGKYCDCFSACNSAPKPCLEGTFNPRPGASSPDECGVCPAGHTCAMETDFPVPCPSAHYCPAATQRDCVVDSFPCQVPCPPGTQGNSTGHAAEKDACTECGQGLFGASPGAVACTPCPSGTFSSQRGSTVCADCPAGYYCGMLSKAPNPCPINTYSSRLRAQDSSTCLPCKRGSLTEKEASPSEAFCNITVATSQLVATTILTSSPVPSTAPALQTPAPVEVASQPMKQEVFRVQAQAVLGGIAGQDVFLSCCAPTFLRILQDMLEPHVASIRIFELCDSAAGCTQARGRLLLQTANVLVKFEMESTNEIELVTAILESSFSFTLSSRLARETGNPTITANVKLISKTAVLVGNPTSPQTSAERDVPAEQSSSPLAAAVITISAVVFVGCNVFWFRKRLIKTCCKTKNGADATLHELQDLDRPDAQMTTPGVAARARAYVSQVTPRTEEQITPRTNRSSRSDGSDESGRWPGAPCEPPSNLPLSLVVRPATITRARTRASTPDETKAPASLAGVSTSTGASDQASAGVPRKPATLSLSDVQDANSSGLYGRAVEPSPRHSELDMSRMFGFELEVSEREADSVTSKDNNDGEQHALLDGKGEVSLTSDGMFELKMSDTSGTKERSVLEADDLAPLFDMVAFKVDGDDTPYIDSAGLCEILQSLDDFQGKNDVREVYSSLGVVFNSNLSLAQLRLAWTMRCSRGTGAQTNTGAGDQTKIGAGHHANINGELEGVSAEQSSGSDNSWDSDGP